jgi:hypothetical protein
MTASHPTRRGIWTFGLKGRFIVSEGYSRRYMTVRDSRKKGMGLICAKPGTTAGWSRAVPANKSPVPYFLPDVVQVHIEARVADPRFSPSGHATSRRVAVQ